MGRGEVLGRAGAWWGRHRSAAIAVALVGVAAGLVPQVVVQAATGGYPSASMPCEWSPHATSGPRGTEWCRDFDWGPEPSTVVSGTETVDEPSTISPRGFGYRNCTDYVAFKLGFTSSRVHGNAAQWRSQIDPAYVSSKPSTGAVAWWGTEVDQGFGHVAVVLSVNADGSAVVGEYNARLDGAYDTRTIPARGPGSADAYLHIRDEAVPGGQRYVPPLPEPVIAVPPAPAPSTSPHPRPAPSPSPALALAPPQVAGDLLGALTPAAVGFRPPATLRPGAAALVEVRITDPARFLSAFDRQLAPAGETVSPGTALGATLTASDARVVATTPAQQALTGPGDAVWQWALTGSRPGRASVTVCFSLGVIGRDGPVGPATRCLPAQTVAVSRLPGVLARGHLLPLGLGAAIVLLGLGLCAWWARRLWSSAAGHG